ncbi:MAG: 2-dehydropantoate 2-reductase [Saccharospirillum sp.]|nr:2-dehydropantoate 2-reductase [Saccharospirillum sp.]
MKIAVVGLGAIGGLLAARLARSGHDVSAIARGATLAAVSKAGLGVCPVGDSERIDHRVPIRVSDDPAQLGLQDLVILSVKSQAVLDVLPTVKALMGPDTRLLSAMNGIPWWFFQGLSPEFNHIDLPSIDPGRTLLKQLPGDRIIGSVTYLSATTPSAGVVCPIADKRIIIGEATGGSSATLDRVKDAFTDAGFAVEVPDSIQKAIWYKLWGNMTMNPVSAITGATGDRILGDPGVRAFISQAMREAQAIGNRIGLPINEDPEARHELTLQLGAFKTSMLQDAEAGKSIELDALVAAVLDIARAVGQEAPSIEALYGLTRLFGQTHGLYPE